MARWDAGESGGEAWGVGGCVYNKELEILDLF